MQLCHSGDCVGCVVIMSLFVQVLVLVFGLAFSQSNRVTQLHGVFFLCGNHCNADHIGNVAILSLFVLVIVLLIDLGTSRRNRVTQLHVVLLYAENIILLMISVMLQSHHS